MYGQYVVHFSFFCLYHDFQGKVSRDFLLVVFFMNQFPPQPLSIPLGPFQIFSKIRGDIRSLRFFNKKNFNNFVGTPLDSRVNIYINFYLQVHFKVSADWYCSHCLPPVSTTPVNWRQNLPRCRWHQWQICNRCRWYWWCTLTSGYLRKCSKKF